MAYYKVRIEVWCDWNPAESDLEDIAQSMGVGEAICTMREVVAVVNRKFALQVFGSVDKAVGSHFRFWGGSNRAEVIGRLRATQVQRGQGRLTGRGPANIVAPVRGTWGRSSAGRAPRSQ